MFRSTTCVSARAACAAFVLSWAGIVTSASAVENAAANAATEARLHEAVKYLSSDELEGRGLDTKGIHTAADYIAKQFRDFGLKTDVYDGKPFQKFELPVGSKLGPKEKNTLSFVGKGEDGKEKMFGLKLADDFQTLTAGGSGKFDVPLVFAGYGITAKNEGYDDYAGIDVKGKAVIVLRHEPEQNNPHSKFAGTKPSRHAFFRTKIANASEHGAAAIIFCTSDADNQKNIERIRKRLDVALDDLENSRQKMKDDKDASAAKLEEHRVEIAKHASEVVKWADEWKTSADPLLAMHRAGTASGGRKIPVVHCRREMIDRILKPAIGKNLATIEKEIDKDLKPRSQELTGWKALGETSIERNNIAVKNVVAVLEAEGPLAEETIVIGAHYDHLGYGGRGSLAGRGQGASPKKAIHNGADDNASGTAALIETARRLAENRDKLKRRVVFIAFTAEESGLLGSAHYVDNPLIPIDKTVAMLNYDMVGRLTDDKLVIFGTGSAAEFDSLVDRQAKDRGFNLTKNASGFGPSDQTSFYKKQIPVMHFFTGTHRDYHRPTDDYDKVNARGMRRVVDLVEDIAVEIATNEKRPTYREVKRGRSPIAKAGSRPYFGSIPDFSGDGKGYKISGVAKGGPAAKGGLKGGDTIIKFGKSQISNLDDFDNALRKFKSGDKVKLTVKREGKEVELEVTLDPPR